MTKVSVILPSLNVAPYIEKCINSVTNQTLNEMEFIFVDAGSVDGTLEIIEKHAQNDKRIKLIHSDKKSYGYQVNQGIRASVGEYIAIVDTDDYIDFEMYEKLYSYVLNTKYDYVKCSYYSFFMDGHIEVSNKNINRNVIDVNHVDYDLVTDLNIVITDIGAIWAGIYKRQFIIDNDLVLNETPGASFQDTSFSRLVVLAAKNCIYIDDCLYHYRTDRAEASVKSNSKCLCVMDEYRFIDEYMKTHGCDSEENIMRIAKLKIDTYYWNLMRLNMESKLEFIRAIALEMQEYLNGGKYEYILSDEQKKELQMLTDIELVIKTEEEQLLREKNLHEIVKKANHIGGCVLVGAGKRFEYFIAVEENRRLVKAVCDNDSNIWGKRIGHFVIQDVESSCKEYSNLMWIITVKNHVNEIKEQLIRLGIEKNRIYNLNC